MIQLQFRKTQARSYPPAVTVNSFNGAVMPISLGIVYALVKVLQRSMGSRLPHITCHLPGDLL